MKNKKQDIVICDIIRKKCGEFASDLSNNQLLKLFEVCKSISSDNTPMPDYPSVFTSLRKLHGLSPTQVADQSGVSRSTLYRMEAGHDCTFSVIKKLHEFFMNKQK